MVGIDKKFLQSSNRVALKHKRKKEIQIQPETPVDKCLKQSPADGLPNNRMVL